MPILQFRQTFVRAVTFLLQNCHPFIRSGKPFIVGIFDSLFPFVACYRTFVSFCLDGITLTFTPEALQLIVDKAVEYKLGARGLRSIVESIMMDAMFEIPSKRTKSFDVTAEYAQKQLDKSHLQ